MSATTYMHLGGKRDVLETMVFNEMLFARVYSGVLCDNMLNLKLNDTSLC